jgi:hypothetical protein
MFVTELFDPATRLYQLVFRYRQHNSQITRIVKGLKNNKFYNHLPEDYYYCTGMTIDSLMATSATEGGTKKLPQTFKLVETY